MEKQGSKKDKRLHRWQMANPRLEPESTFNSEFLLITLKLKNYILFQNMRDARDKNILSKVDGHGILIFNGSICDSFIWPTHLHTGPTGTSAPPPLPAPAHILQDHQNSVWVTGFFLNELRGIISIWVLFKWKFSFLEGFCVCVLIQSLWNLLTILCSQLLSGKVRVKFDLSFIIYYSRSTWNEVPFALGAVTYTEDTGIKLAIPQPTLSKGQ